jgi:hypothetical protein
MSERGSIIPNGVVLKEHEMATVVLLTELGCNVELIPKSNLQGVRTPDVRIEGLLWEIKSPKGEGKSLMKNTVQKTCRQSCNVIVDLRRVKRYQEKCLSELNREFEYSRSLKRLKIIIKNGSIIDLVKN